MKHEYMDVMAGSSICDSLRQQFADHRWMSGWVDDWMDR